MHSLLDDARDALDARDRERAARYLTALERQLTVHLRMESELLLPLADPAAAAEMHALREEHGTLLAQLEQLVAALREPALEVRGVAELSRALRAHAARAEAPTHPIVDAALHAPLRASLLRRIRERLSGGPRPGAAPGQLRRAS